MSTESVSNPESKTRRRFLKLSAAGGAGLLLAGCSGPTRPDAKKETAAQTEGDDSDPRLTASEELMFEHGILRRGLMVYESATKLLRTDPSSVSPELLHNAAQMFRSLGEDFHQLKLEEAFVFPAVAREGGPASALVRILAAQHARGREITDFILSKSMDTRSIVSSADQLARVLDDFVRMYQHHTALEDTIIFPAWKETLFGDRIDEMSSAFRELEASEFGKDGLDGFLSQLSVIESDADIDDLEDLTAPTPPKINP